MENLRELISTQVQSWLANYVPGFAGAFYIFLVLVWITISALVLHFVFHRVVLKIVSMVIPNQDEDGWLYFVKKHGLFSQLVFIAQCVIVQIQAKAWLAPASWWTKTISSGSDLLILFFSLAAVFSLLDAFLGLMNRRARRLQVPLKGVIQTAKLIFSLLFGLVAIAIILGKSPIILLSSLGAISAVLMLVFRDPILGLTAGIQLSVNNMLMVGDWLEMPKYDADGDVLDIGLTTVKVQNWDKTITTIPTYALISDSFKNWRGMSESGGRRIKRKILINLSSIKFLEASDVERLKKSRLLAPYLDQKVKDIEESNTQLQADMTSVINGRRLTNVGTFRSYLLSYLKSHPRIKKDLTLMVRQLEVTSEGLALEIYAFSNTTAWEDYENIQSDIFDHIFAAMPEFGLVAHESPIGKDVREVGTAISSSQWGS